ncbi:MAG: DUF1211 domain-containing protein [Methanomicrobiales archaeon]|nr:DUF1211 domain-containing protein [Methanomicrobiales archaeon]
MPGEETSQHFVGISKGRMEALSDGIFAFAMTLLVLGFVIPPIQGTPLPTDVDDILVSLSTDFIHYIIAFLILSGMWVSHHFLTDKMPHTDRNFLRLNMLILLFVALIPFSTLLVGDFSGVPLANIVFETNLLVVSGMIAIQWWYVTRHPFLLRNGIMPEYLRIGIYKALVTPAISVIGILLSVGGMAYTTWVYLFVPLGIYIAGKAAQK